MNIKKIAPLLLSSFIAPAMASEATILSEETEHVAGSIVGGSSFFLIGGALTGGPVGALVGGLAGSYTGAAVQESAKLSGRAYKVRFTDGSTDVLRSPYHQFNNGDLVAVINNRPVPITE